MPIYGYNCGACGHRFDRLQKMSEPDPSTCPRCRAGNLAREVSAAAVRLKGSGWYETDFKGGLEKRRNLADPSPGNGPGTTP